MSFFLCFGRRAIQHEGHARPSPYLLLLILARAYARAPLRHKTPLQDPHRTPSSAISIVAASTFHLPFVKSVISTQRYCIRLRLDISFYCLLAARYSTTRIILVRWVFCGCCYHVLSLFLVVTLGETACIEGGAIGDTGYFMIPCTGVCSSLALETAATRTRPRTRRHM